MSGLLDSFRELYHHSLCCSPIRFNISSFGFTEPSESKDSSRCQLI